jgi:exonuclease III
LNHQTSKMKKGEVSTYHPIITLNLNGLNSLAKRHRLTEWIKKQDPTVFCLRETHLTDKGRHRLKVKGLKMIFQAIRIWKQAGVAILISDKADFKWKLVEEIKNVTTY